VAGVLFVMGLVVTIVWVCTAAPAHAAKLERLRIAVAPLGWDTNFTWLGPRSSNLDKRPALEFLVGIDRHTGAYIPELAEKWEMAPDGKTWTITLRQGVKFHDNCGEFTAKDVVHTISQIVGEGLATDSGLFRTLFGTTEEEVRKSVQTPDDYTVVFKLLRPELNLDFVVSAQAGNLLIHRKGQGDKEGLAETQK